MELRRFRQAMRRGGRAFEQRIFTPRELAYAGARPRTRLLHLAARFAAKEATIKALSQVLRRGVPTMREVEVCNDRTGRPQIALHRRGMHGVMVHISLSHTETMAMASALAVR